MNKLELKHLAPYLPYGLKMHEYYSNQSFTVEGIKQVKTWFNVYYKETKECGLICNSNRFQQTTKPILHPLSDLTKENIVELGLFVDADREFLIQSPLQCSYEDVKYLLSNHYDVFKLIDQGLAIDINTLP